MESGVQMTEEWIKVAAPATISNLGPGFDVFGMALKDPYDIVYARRNDGGVKVLSIEGPGADELPVDPMRNSAAIAAEEVLRRCDADFGMDIKIVKGIRPCSGIGSSGASAAGGAYAAHILTGRQLSDTELVLCAAQAEEVTSGGLHADNVAPSLLGGFTVIRSYMPLEVVRIEPPKNLGVVVAMPDVIVSTKESRKALPTEVSVKDLIFHVGNGSCLVYAMVTNDLDLLGRSVKDAVFEPARNHLIPHLSEAKSAALSHGAKASFLGGSGPCVISFFDSDQFTGESIAEAVCSVFRENGIACQSWITVSGSGCKEV